MKHPVDQWTLPVILALYFLLGAAYSLVNPILESPDELLNYENVRYMIENRALPILQAGEFSKAHHPPLYYVLGAAITASVPNEELRDIVANDNPFWGYRIYDQGVDNKSQYLHDPDIEGWPYRDAVLGIRMLRLVSILMGAGIIIVIYQTSRALFIDEPALAWGAAGLVAFNPMFLFIQSSVHNDALTNLLAALTIFGVVLYWTRGPSVGRMLFLGLIASLGILTKITFLFLGPVVVAAVVARSWQDRHEKKRWWRTALKMLAVGGAVVLLVTGWWFVRNQNLYGDPTSMSLQASIWQPRENTPDWASAFNELTFLRDSFWGVFGFGQIPLHRPVYRLLWILELVAVSGLILWAVRARMIGRRTKDEGQKALQANGNYRVPGLLLGVLLVAPLTAFLAIFGRMTVSSSANFGRYLFTSYAVIAPLLVLGLTEWIPGPWRRLFLGGITSLLVVLAVYALGAVLRPAYAAPPIYYGQDANSNNGQDAIWPYFGGQQLEIDRARDDVYPHLAKLIGYDLSPESAVPGERIDVTLFWEVIGQTENNYSLFVQLVDAKGERIAGRDTHPGLGRYPTSRWQIGEIIQDEIPLYVPSEASGPQGLLVNMGLRDEMGNLLKTEAGQDTITLETIRLAGSETTKAVGEAVHYLLDDRVELIAVELPGEKAAAGNTVPFTLTWRAVENLSEDFVVFVHLLDDGDKLVATFDHPPANGSYPTHLWQAGDTVIDSRLIQLPDDLSPGSYRVYVGWYRLGDLTRLPVIDSQGQPVTDAAMSLFTLEIGN